jgi:seryl-tRNA synthetase
MNVHGINKAQLKKDHAAIYQRRMMSEPERRKVQKSANGIRAQIVQFFESFPNARISPSEFKELMKLPNPIHSIRPRFTDLEDERWIQAMENDKVATDFNGVERRYVRMQDDGQMQLL